MCKVQGIQHIIVEGTGSRVIETNDKFRINAFPNPNNGNLFVSIDAAIETAYEIDLIDITGRTVMAERGFVDIGQNIRSLDLNSLPQGIYMLRFRFNNESEVIRIMLE